MQNSNLESVFLSLCRWYWWTPKFRNRIYILSKRSCLIIIIIPLVAYYTIGRIWVTSVASFQELQVRRQTSGGHLVWHFNFLMLKIKVFFLCFVFLTACESNGTWYGFNHCNAVCSKWGYHSMDLSCDSYLWLHHCVGVTWGSCFSNYPYPRFAHS